MINITKGQVMRDLINLLESLLESVSRLDIESFLRKNGHPDLKVTGNKIAILVQMPDGAKQGEFRQKILNELLVQMKQNFPKSSPLYSNDPTLSSVGGIVFGDNPTKLVVKDSGIQGNKSAGVANEIELASILQSIIDKFGSVNVTFTDPRHNKISMADCTEIIVSGRESSGHKKADIVLSSPKRKLPISIKKLNAEAWESADNLFGKKARKIIDSLIKSKDLKLIKLDQTRKGQSVYALSKEIVVEPTSEEALSAIFGSDLNPKGGIVIQTFKPEHFTQDGNKVTVQAHAVIAKKEDIPESHLMVWLLRNDSTRNSPAVGYPGIRIMGVTLTRGIGATGTKDVILVNQHGDKVSATDADWAPKPKPKVKEPLLQKRIHPLLKPRDSGRKKR